MELVVLVRLVPDMYYTHFNEEENTVTISLERLPEYGQLIGVISDDDFRNINHKFLVQSLFNARSIEAQGVDIQIELGPSNKS